MSVIDSLRSTAPADHNLEALGFAWLGDLLRIRGMTFAYVASYMLDVFDSEGHIVVDENDKPLKVQYWKAHDKHGLRISGYVETREEAVRQAEAWTSDKNQLLVNLIEENRELRQRLAALED